MYKINETICYLRSSNAGNIFVQLMAQHWLYYKLNELLLVLPPRLNLPRNKFQCCKLQQYVAQTRPDSTFCNNLFNFSTLKFVAWKVEHAVVIRATTTSLTCNATMLCDKLNENVARITRPLSNIYV